MDDIVQDDEIVFGGECYLCGKQITNEGTDPVRVTIELSPDSNRGPAWQVFWCHLACFKGTIDPGFISRFGGVGGEGLPES
jgi:hypothetical protein